MSSQGGSGVSDVDAFRSELRSWLHANLTPEVVEAGGRNIESNLEVLREWNRMLADGGWAAPSWPVEHGGRGSGVPEQLIYMEEMSQSAGARPGERDRGLEHRAGDHALRHR